MADLYYPEYNPTPFGGGFDLEEVYGKSNPPSEKSCYSPSHVDPDDLTSLRDDEDDKLSVVSAYGVEIPPFDDALHATDKPSIDSIPLAHEDHSEPQNKTANDSQQTTLSKPEEREPNSEGHWEPNYPVPEYHLRDSDLALCPKCAMPLYCNCGCQIFSFNTSEYEEESYHYEQESSEDVGDKVARWLFSSSYI